MQLNLEKKFRVHCRDPFLRFFSLTFGNFGAELGFYWLKVGALVYLCC
jgi:hypothetical protein